MGTGHKKLPKTLDLLASRIKMGLPAVQRGNPNRGILSSMKVQLFGGPTLEEKGKSVSLSPFQAALLSVVFTEGREKLPRRFVQELLWDDPEGRLAKHRLSQLVYQLGQKTSVRIVEFEGTSLVTRLHLVHSDLDDFEEYIRRPDYRVAKTLI